MFSRIILGMHSLNQVLFGFMIGVYTFIPYYLFVENLLLKVSLTLFRSIRLKKSLIYFIYIIILMTVLLAI